MAKVTILNYEFLSNPVWAWFLALAVAALVFFVLRLILNFGLRRLSALAARTKTEVDNLIIAALRQTKTFFLVILVVYVGSLALTLPPTVNQVLGTLSVVAFFLQAGFWGQGAITYWITRYTKRKLPENAATVSTINLLGFLAKLALWSIIILVALDHLGIPVTSLIAGLGIGGIAVALAVQNVLGDLFASLSIVIDKPFVIGDFIIVDDLLGTVEQIGLKSTRIRSLSGEQLVVSNNDLLRSRIRNYKRMYERRVVFSFGVIYQTPYEKLVAIPGMVREIIESQEKTRFDRAHFMNYGDFALVFEVVYYVLSPDYNVYMDIQQAINLAIYRRFQEEGIEFAYPTQTVYVNTELMTAPGREN